MKVLFYSTSIIFSIIGLLSCQNIASLGAGYFLDGDEIVFRYQSAGPGFPKLPWDNKYMKTHADKASFISLKWPGYGKDKNNYYYQGKPITNIDYPTFEISDYTETDYDPIGIVKDKNHVYKLKNPWNIIQGANPKTYQIAENVKGNGNWFWYKDDRNYYVNDTMVYVDYDSFKSIDDDHRFYADKNNIYLLKSEYKKTALISISATDINHEKITYTNGLLQTEHALYYETKKGKFTKIPVRNISTVKYFSPANVYMIIDEQVYCDGEVLANVDIATFTVYQHAGSAGYTAYAKDKNNVYYHREILEDANPSVVQLADNYIEDELYRWVPEYGSTSTVIRKTAKVN